MICSSEFSFNTLVIDLFCINFQSYEVINQLYDIIFSNCVNQLLLYNVDVFDDIEGLLVNLVDILL